MIFYINIKKKINLEQKMKGACVFVFFMICNALLGLKGLGILIVGILSIVRKKRRLSAVPRTLASIDILSSFISLMVIGGYITIIFILGVFSKNRRGVLIAYFVLIIILIIVDVAMAAMFGNLKNLYPYVYEYNVCTIIYGVSAAFSGLTFILAIIYFVLIGKEDNTQLVNDVRNMEYMNIPQQYQNV